MKSYLEGKKLNKIEKNKAMKDGLLIGSQIEDFAKIGWEKMDKTDLELRLKWYGMFWRPKTPGKFMLRLRVTNGILKAVIILYHNILFLNSTNFHFGLI